MPGTVRGKGFIRMRIKFAGADVSRNGSVELLRVENLEPRAKPRQLARSKLFDGFFDFFGSGHVRSIAFLLPSLHERSEWRGGLGVGGLDLLLEASLLKHPPPPTPPRRCAGRGEEDVLWTRPLGNVQTLPEKKKGERPMPIIDSQVHAYEANTPKRPWAQRAELARSRHRRRDGGGDGQGRRRRRDLHLVVLDVPL